jgi:serine/threonine protein phosphatase PrpC
MTEIGKVSSSLGWTSAGLSDTGKVRQINEDAFLDRPEAGLWAVADGMGGHDAGNFASTLIIDRLATIAFPDDLGNTVDLVQKTLKEVNQELLDEAHSRGNAGTIGSTLVVLLAHDGHCACLWAGDSRVYRLRHGILQALTRDHSLVEDLVEQGLLLRRDAECHPDANVITRAVGAMEYLDVDVQFDEVRTGDRYLLCSDGLYKELSTREIGNAMQFGSDCKAISRDLLQNALDRGARDNVTVVLVEIVQ